MVEMQRNGKFEFGQNMASSDTPVTKGRFTESLARDHVVHLGLNISSSAYVCGCMVNGW